LARPAVEPFWAAGRGILRCLRYAAPVLLGSTDLQVFPLCLGGNVFGRTADEQQSFEVLDAYFAAGGNFIDTANIYAGGASEQIIGRWMASRRNRDEIVIATKVGMGADAGLSPQRIAAAVEQSLKSLQTDRIDLYYAHKDDEDTPLAQTLTAFDALVKEGKARYIAASNYSPDRLAKALEISEQEGLASFVALQPHYNLLVRDEYEGPLQELCAQRGLPCLPYFSLAQGFLTGKYRRGGGEVQSTRAGSASAYMNERGWRVIDALDDVSAAHQTTVSAVALAWLAAQPTVATPITSARTVQQLQDLLPLARLTLSDSEVQLLSDASR
jgi:aryl-alcohol dehydrogenase-like predicted oxidoreductase